MSGSFGSPTANWRSAFELASLIQHDPKIGSDPVLLGELTDLLSHELDQPGCRPQADPVRRPDAGGVPDSGREDRERPERRPARAAGAALSTPSIETPIRIAAAASLAKQAARLDGKLEDAGAVKALGEAAASGEPEARQMAVYALGFFGGTHGHRATCASGSSRTKTDTSDTTPPWRWPPRRPGCRGARSAKCSPLPTSPRSSICRATPRSRTRSRRSSSKRWTRSASLSSGSPELARSLATAITELSKSGLVSVRSQAHRALAKFTSQALNYTPRPRSLAPLARATTGYVASPVARVYAGRLKSSHTACSLASAQRSADSCRPAHGLLHGACRPA